MYQNFNVLRNSVEIRVETKDLKANKTYVEAFFCEIVEYEYLGNSNILKSIKVNQILELDKYIKTGDSQKFERIFTGDNIIPSGLRFFIESGINGL